MFIIFTGNGKGKTTAAIGQALRAVGNGARVLMVQFIKGPWESGEDKSSRSFGAHFRIVKMGKGFVGLPSDKLPRHEHEKAAQAALSYALSELMRGACDIIILDEVWVALTLKLISKKDVSDFIDAAKPLAAHIIMTGRGCPKEFVAEADLVTEMKEVKHPFNAGVAAAKNVEF
ncbi:MAG TPA: cob(I)yrinic acid a,c-diamide adenosyltransferase [Candidatus Paceibacterota bacterium]|nr:cob(I)yrinic acid a,c-diamide adenosyltransferase [Candidatus Paceibacterota bacterium]